MSRLPINFRPIGLRTVGRRTAPATIAFVLVLVLAVAVTLALGGAHAAAAAGPASPSPSPADGSTLENAAEPTVEAASGDATAPIDPALAEADGTVRVVVGFEPFDPETVPDDVVAARQAHATTAQEPLESYVTETDGVDLERGFWITNVAVVTVDTDRASLEDVAALENVTAVRTDDAVATVVRPNADSSGDGAATVTTDEDEDEDEDAAGLDDMRVPRLWDEFDTRGDGTTVAVLDSGVDADHPDLEIDGWKDFADDPSPKPVDYDGHGTHVTGIVGAGDGSGTHLGVAPDVELLHGAVITDCEERCVGKESRILAGIEWAIEEDADVVTMSFGWSEYRPSVIRAVENANGAGTVVVAGAGNGGEGTSISPANVYDSIAVGASATPDRIAGFSAGEEIDTDDAWGYHAPPRWPDSYVVPDVVAPGIGIESTAPGGKYDSRSGTSKAAPHVAGTVALIQSATDDDLAPAELEAALEGTARKPDGEPDEPDTRFGSGFVDALAAVDAAGDHARVSGTVADATTGDALEGATVELVAADGTTVETTTDAEGRFERYGLEPGEYEIAVEKPGYETARRSLTLEADERADLEIVPTGAGEIDVRIADAHFETGVGNATVRANGSRGEYPGTHLENGNGTYRIADVPAGESYAVDLRAEGYEDATLTVPVPESTAGKVTTVEESVTLQGDATLEVTVEREDGEPIPNATVVLERDGATFELDERTDGDGTVATPVPGTGDAYTVEAAADGFTTNAVETAPLEGGASASATVTLSESLLAVPGFGWATATVALAVATVALLARGHLGRE
ncbi:peptidase S8 [Halobiforma lacisalsi AJ5]|uniref:Peptidase S8 n=1 Tax=Natronobacterium lacisalsi AJ5 TaxID=358396 RepID=M0L7T7_NATLA|nr:S8 family serine peptidase [Halobiforma lacisalsi]APW97889.1 peptidase S8 [Halobiforma lacisalsi AJ5]EMA29158.1 peptidase S8 and S53 subtilisin kexin sedolisin [Halobiforma lacisalsi AJ5]